MIRSYVFVLTDHQKLHDFVVSFFHRIAVENGDFSDSFIDPEFLIIVNKHPELLRSKLVCIYNEFKNLSQSEKDEFLCNLVQSNDIEQICAGNIIPLKKDNLPTSIKKDVAELFVDLYTKILRPKDKAFSEKYGTLLDHFKKFKLENPNISCPMCGLRDVETFYDSERDEYDHYLPKNIYPLSSVNFKNLVPVCSKCNSLQVKGEKDVISDTTGKLFYPYSANHQHVEVGVVIAQNSSKVDEIEWQLNFFCASGVEDKIASWKYIYNIESRYIAHLKSRVSIWYKAYSSVKSKIAINREDYLKILEIDKGLSLEFLREPAMRALLLDPLMIQAEEEARRYS